MPWSAKRSGDCPDDRPYAVVDDETGEKVACHATEESAKEQVAALYANTDQEHRSLDFDDCEPELRSVPFTDVDSSSDGGHFEGYAAVFDREVDLGSFTESISRGAFRRALAGAPNVPMLYDHNTNHPILATTRSGTLRLDEDGKGLRVRADVADHYMGQAVRELVRRGDIGGMSFGFVAGRGNSKVENRGGKPHRNLTGFNRLLDVSPTWDEAYSGTEAAFRSLRKLQDADDVEQVQQDLSGAHQQREDGASEPPADAGEGSEEVRSGVSRPHLLAAKRRLQIMRATLPRDSR